MKPECDQAELDQQITKKIGEIRGFTLHMQGQSVRIIPDEWREVPASDVQVRACSLNLWDHDLNVANVVFRPGGHVAPHTHQSEEMIFCIAGTYVDELNNRTLTAGDVQVIPVGQPHSGRSDDALLVCTWRPAFRNERPDTC